MITEKPKKIFPDLDPRYCTKEERYIDYAMTIYDDILERFGLSDRCIRHVQISTLINNLANLQETYGENIDFNISSYNEDEFSVNIYYKHTETEEQFEKRLIAVKQNKMIQEENNRARKLQIIEQYKMELGIP